MEYDPMRVFFDIKPLVVHTFLLSVLQCLDPIGQKVINCRYDVLI